MILRTVTIAAGLLLSTAVASPSSAAPQEAGAVCSWGANPPYLHSRTVNATVWSSGSCASTGQFRGVLQRKRAWGWQELDRETWWGNGAASLSRGCHAGDTFTYRAILYRWPSGSSKIGPQRRFTCR